MDKSTLAKLTQQVIRKFPEMEGVRPSMKRTCDSNNGEKYELTYKGSASLPGGKTMRRVVRVIADEKGRILRMSTSK
jgi:hypothetical protein